MIVEIPLTLAEAVDYVTRLCAPGTPYTRVEIERRDA
jgi:hypothetical protein